ncbi:hypothetical protein CY34DRAFT_802235 [Suillus luteus UH-Slu-Lm8-n1]|uniref:Uncharacterized protein n=1 Tax=Suillus luteus UH-Slu-Lm8-n1 TaxID=930992 RepID=A0A0D0B4N2_9AGAM|nr:hypothetical protein CY34DRAFT_802235 [Suillus luteus UH-Slu-Lm8-n1]
MRRIRKLIIRDKFVTSLSPFDKCFLSCGRSLLLVFQIDLLHQWAQEQDNARQ